MFGRKKKLQSVQLDKSRRSDALGATRDVFGVELINKWFWNVIYHSKYEKFFFLCPYGVLKLQELKSHVICMAKTWFCLFSLLFTLEAETASWNHSQRLSHKKLARLNFWKNYKNKINKWLYLNRLSNAIVSNFFAGCYHWL